MPVQPHKNTFETTPLNSSSPATACGQVNPDRNLPNC
jgi:hypothetical protein